MFTFGLFWFLAGLFTGAPAAVACLALLTRAKLRELEMKDQFLARQVEAKRALLEELRGSTKAAAPGGDKIFVFPSPDSLRPDPAS